MCELVSLFVMRFRVSVRASYDTLTNIIIVTTKQLKNSREGRCVTRMFRGPFLVDDGRLVIGCRPCADLITDLAVVTI